MNRMKSGFRVEGNFWFEAYGQPQPLTAQETKVFYLHPPAWASDNDLTMRMAFVGQAEMHYLLTIQAMLRNPTLATKELVAQYAAINNPDLKIIVRSSNIEWVKR